MAAPGEIDLRELLHVSVPALYLLEDHLDEASFLCLCMDCRLVGAISLKNAMSLFRHHSKCASAILVNKLRTALVYEDIGTQDRLRRVLEIEHITEVNIENCLELFQVKTPTHNEIIDLLKKLGIFSAYRLVDQLGFVQLMIALAQYCEQEEKSV